MDLSSIMQFIKQKQDAANANIAAAQSNPASPLNQQNQAQIAKNATAMAMGSLAPAEGALGGAAEAEAPSLLQRIKAAAAKSNIVQEAEPEVAQNFGKVITKDGADQIGSNSMYNQNSPVVQYQKDILNQMRKSGQTK